MLPGEIINKVEKALEDLEKGLVGIAYLRLLSLKERLLEEQLREDIYWERRHLLLDVNNN